MALTPLMVSLRIPGEWRDAWLYREHLVVWQRDNTMLSVSLDSLLRDVARHYDEATATALEYALLRNDWKNSDQFRKLTRIPGIAENLRSALRATADGITLTTGALGFEPAHVEPAAGVLLDSHIYANRIYCASTEGLFESRFYGASGVGGHQEQLMSRRVADVSAKYACLNVSAEDEGLWFQPIAFKDQAGLSGAIKFERVAEMSLGISHASRHLLNYIDASVPQFLRAQAHRGRATEGAEYDEWQVSGYQEPLDFTRAAAAALEVQGKVELEAVETMPNYVGAPTIDVLGNSDYRLLIDWRDELHVLDISAYEDRDVALRPDRRFAAANRISLNKGDVLQTYAIGAGFLVETFDEVRLLTDSGAYLFFRGAAARVRTFTSSRRYKDVGVVIDDRAMHIIGFL